MHSWVQNMSNLEGSVSLWTIPDISCERGYCRNLTIIESFLHCYSFSRAHTHTRTHRIWPRNQSVVAFWLSAAVWLKSLSAERLSKREIYLFSQQNFFLKPDNRLISHTNPVQLQLCVMMMWSKESWKICLCIVKVSISLYICIYHLNVCVWSLFTYLLLLHA